jgi:hypothetical protein
LTGSNGKLSLYIVFLILHEINQKTAKPYWLNASGPMSKIRIELFLFFLLCLVQVHAQDAGARGGVLLKTDKNSDAGKTRAVIIGISKYSNLPPQRQLDYADKDAELFYTYLQLTKSVADCRVFLTMKP